MNNFTLQALADHWQLSHDVIRTFNRCRRLILAGKHDAAKSAALTAIYGSV